MSEELKESAKVLLLELVFSGREVMQSKSGLDKAMRERLERQGLIALEKRGRAIFLTATDRTWKWVEENLEFPLVRSQPRRALAAVLSRLREFLAAEGLSLSGFVRPKAPAQEAEANEGGPLEARLRRAYLARTGGALHTRVRLAELRAALPDIDREALDSEILSLQQNERAALFPLDNPREIGPEDERAAIALSGVPQHIIYLRG
jgi:hypothetical protein